MSKKRSSVLPHLPKGISLPEIHVTGSQPMMPGQKMLPPSSSSSDDNNSEQQQLVPSTASNMNRSIVKQGVLPWSDSQHMGSEPPPMFTATPKKSQLILQESQKRVYRMEGGIDPVVLLTSRLEAWRFAIKNLTTMFKKIVLVEDKTSKGLVNASKEIILPFRKSNHGQFLESGGIQDVWSAVRDYTMQHGILHHENSGYIQGAVLASLRSIKGDIKTFISQMEKDKSLKSNLIFDSRMQVDRLISRLDKLIESTQRSPHDNNNNTDPFLINLGIIHAVRQLCDHENRLHDSVLNLQKELGIFEGKIIENVRHVLTQYQEFRLKHKMESIDYIGKVTETFDTIKPTTEWNEFVRRHQFNLVMENSGYKTENMIQYPNQKSKYVRAIKIGPLQLKTGIIKNWTEGVYLLTPAGFLHGYKTPKHFQTNPLCPSYSIFVPNATIEPTQDAFELRHIKKEKGKITMGGFHYTFRAPTRTENQEWLNALMCMSDQLRVVPLLDTRAPEFSSAAPLHRDLPALPANTLPLAAIEATPLASLHEDASTTTTTTPKQPSFATMEDQQADPDDDWHSSHDDPDDDFDTQSKVVDEEEDLQHLRNAYAPPLLIQHKQGEAAL